MLNKLLNKVTLTVIQILQKYTNNRELRIKSSVCKTTLEPMVEVEMVEVMGMVMVKMVDEVLVIMWSSSPIMTQKITSLAC